VANGDGTLGLNITGAPAISGIASFSLTLGRQSCTVIANVQASAPKPPLPTESVCTSPSGPDGRGNFTSTVNIGGNNVTVTVTSVTNAPGYSSATRCGLAFPITAWGLGYLGNASSVTFHFSRPVSNIQFLFSANMVKEVITCTARNGAKDVTTDLALKTFGGTCVSAWTVAQNQLSYTTDPRPGSNLGAGIALNVGGTYFTDLTLEHNAVANAGGTGTLITFCNAVSQ
jgi:hypothetical protein